MRNHVPLTRRGGLAAAFASGLALAVMLAAGSPVAADVQSPVAGPADTTLNPGQFRGVNWADQRDNFANDELVPSGLSTSDDYFTTYAKGAAIAGSFKDLGFNTLRLPVNPHSVGNVWWASYAGAIDAALDLEMNVLLSYWEGSGANADGVVDNPTTWWAMWETIVGKYWENERVYFGPMNEPHGYSSTAWANLAAAWLDQFPDIPRNRVFVSGHGYSENLSVVCNDSRLDGTYLALHNYAFWNTFSYPGWIADYQTNNRLAGCGHRTILEEFGVPMTTGLDFNSPPSGLNGTNTNYVNFLRASTDLVRDLGMGSIYWPGLRTNDSYRLTTLAGSGTDLSLVVTNQSALDRLRWAWGPDPDIDPPETAHAVSPTDPDGLDGWYISPPQLTLTAEDPGENASGVAETVYAVDDEDEHAYTSPVSITSNGMISVAYRSRDEAGNWESPKDFQLKVDTEAPVSELTMAEGASPEGVYISQGGFSLEATDNASGVDRIEYRLGEDPFETYDNEVEVTSPGEYLLEYRAVDVAGNIESTREASFTVATPPDPPAPPAPPKLALQAKKKAVKLNRRGKGKVRITVRNRGGSPATTVRVCTKSPKRLKVKRCQSFGTIAAGRAKTKAFRVTAKKRFKRRANVRFTLTARGLGRTNTKVRVRR